MADLSSTLRNCTACDEADEEYVLEALKDALQAKNNQLASVRQICSNQSSKTVLLIAWLLFGAICLAILGAYTLKICHQRHFGATNLASGLQCPSVRTAATLLYDTFAGLGLLAFYYYDLVTSIIVLGQVWGTWPGYVLLAIFLVHFATTGGIVAYHGFNRLADVKHNVPDVWPRTRTAIVVLSLLSSPLMIPVVLVLDTCAFVRQVFRCAQHFTHWFGFRWVRVGYLAACVFHRSLSDIHYFGLKWVDLEKYESMHNLVAAVFQSFPTMVLNSLLFSLGNKPSHGVFLSVDLFAAAFLASSLAVLKCLIVLLWQAYRTGVNPVVYAVRVVVGQTLSGHNSSAPPTVRSSSIELLVQQYEASGSAPFGAPAQA